MDDRKHHGRLNGLVRLIDHPFHIHINPFQITEVFDPNEGLVDPATNALLGQLQEEDQKGNPVGKVMTREECDKLPDGTH